jgi:hypothetical protein
MTHGWPGSVLEFHLAAIVQNLKMLAGRLFRPTDRASLRIDCVASVQVVRWVHGPRPVGEDQKRSDLPVLTEPN